MTRSTNARLIITDGTSENTASMLVDMHGVNLQDWLPNSPNAVGSIWSSSPYQDSKHLINKTYDNIIDTFTLVISSGAMDTTIRNFRKFIKLLEKAVLYWTDEYNIHKFWLEVRGECETNIRYALVIDYQIPEIDNPFSPPFEASPESTLDEIQLSIEHTIWQDSLTIGTDCIKASAGREDYPGLETDYFVPLLSSDDGTSRAPGTMVLNNDFLTLGGGLDEVSVIRFRNVDIPAGATITNAYVEFTPTTDASGIHVNVLIKGEKSFAPATFSTWADYAARVKTTAGVYWNNIDAWYDSIGEVSPNIKTIIQEIIDIPGWAALCNLALFFLDNSSDLPQLRYGASVDNATYQEPRLHITWSVGGAVEHGVLTPTCDREAAVVPYWNGRSLTHAYYYDDSAGTYSANLVSDAATRILPIAPAVGDAFMACIEDIPGFPSTPITNLVVNLSAASVDITSVDALISDGAGGWIAQPVHYNYECFLLPGALVGLNITTWALQDTWVMDTYNGVTGYWIRFEVTAVGAAPTPPYKDLNKPIFSVMWPYIDIDSTQIQGDISALIDMLLAIGHGAGVSNILIGAKKYSRTNGGRFVPYIPFDDSTLAPDVVVGVTPADILQTPECYTGTCANWVTLGAAQHRTAIIYLDRKTYAGRYRAFIRAKVNVGAVGEIGIWLKITTLATAPALWSDTQIVYNTDDNFTIYDIGLINFPSEILLEENIFDIAIEVWLSSADAADIELYDLVLMPVDEANMEIVYANEGIGTPDSSLDYPIKVVTSNLKEVPYAVKLFNNTSNGFFDIDWNYPVQNFYRAAILGSFRLEPEEEYWIIFFFYNRDWVAGTSYFEHFLFPNFDKTQRYLLVRGNE